jgi:UDP-N-acetylmuramoyl-tripeptide--D-alanyl-D-alanine ligase
MITLSATEIADAIGAHRRQIADEPANSGPLRATVDSREAGAGDIFFGLTGEQHDGGRFAGEVIEGGAWGVVVADEHFEATCTAAQAAPQPAAVFAVADPLSSLGLLANRWRHELKAQVIGVTGSTGKTSTKDILAALIGRSHTVAATPANRNTEIGLPLTVLATPHGTEVLVLEMAMRGAGQIAELARIAEPDVGCIVNVGPVHLEQLGSMENVAAAKAELIAALGRNATAVVPANEPLLEPHLREGLTTTTFGPGGDVRLLGEDVEGVLRIATPAGEVQLRPSFNEHHLTVNLLAAVACAQAIGAPVEGDLTVNFSALRGEVREVLGGVTLIDDCYNANPVSMRAALDNLARGGGRRVAVLGGMAELGPQSEHFHREIAAHAAETGVELLVTVGELARAYAAGYPATIEHVNDPEEAARIVRERSAPGDTVLVKGSRSVGLERIGEVLLELSRSEWEVQG